MKYLVQNQCRQDSSSYSWFQVWDYWHLISTRTEWRLHMICTHSGLKQEVTAAVVGHLVEEPVCSNWRWSVSQVFFIRICSISSIWRICTASGALCNLYTKHCVSRCFSVSAVTFRCSEVRKHKAQSSKTPKLDSPVAQRGDRWNMGAFKIQEKYALEIVDAIDSYSRPSFMLFSILFCFDYALPRKQDKGKGARQRHFFIGKIRRNDVTDCHVSGWWWSWQDGVARFVFIVMCNNSSYLLMCYQFCHILACDVAYNCLLQAGPSTWTY